MSKPREFDFTKIEEITRWFDEMEDYLKCCNGLEFINAGTDLEGRKFALQGFHKLKKLHNTIQK